MVAVEEAVVAMAQVPGAPEHLFVCTKSSLAFVVDLGGRVVRRFCSENGALGDFLCATVSPQGEEP